MGSTTSSPIANPNDTTPKPTSSSSQTHIQNPPNSNTQLQKSTQDPVISSDKKNPETEEEEEEEEEEEGECGFCIFMKGGGCKDTFVDWEKCIEQAEDKKEDIVDKCFEVTAALKKCMDVHSDYYAPILMAEKAAEADVVKEIEKEELLRKD